MGTDKGKRDDDSTSSSNEIVSLATGMGFGLLIFIGGGVLLDNWLKTSPVFLLIGFFFALASIGAFLWKIATAGRKP